MKLNKKRASEVIQRRVGLPLGLRLDRAAVGIRTTADQTIAREIERTFIAQAGEKEALKEMVLVVYGGAGPAHCCSFADLLGIKKILTTPFSPVFSAFGSSIMDVLHLYSETKPMLLFDGKEYASDTLFLNDQIEHLRAVALRDMRGEGFSSERIELYLEFIVRAEGDEKEVRVRLPYFLFQKKGDWAKIYKEFLNEYKRLTPSWIQAEKRSCL